MYHINITEKRCVVQCGEGMSAILDPTAKELEALGPPALPRGARVWREVMPGPTRGCLTTG